MIRCLLFGLLALHAAAALDFAPCGGDAPDHLKIWKVWLSSGAVDDAILAGSRACLHVEAKPDIALRSGARLRIDHPALGQHELSIDVCKAKGIECPTAPNTNVSIAACEDVPLHMMVMAGQQLSVALSALDEASAPIGCLHAVVPVAEAIATDEELEMLAAPAHERLRAELREASTNGAPPEANVEANADNVGPRLQEAYEASPEWAEAFHAWRRSHGKAYGRRLDDVADAADSAQGLLAEARAFATFRKNVLSSHHADRKLSLDERSDMEPEQRRTLSHFA